MPKRPAYLRIADDLRAAILDHTYPPGTRLPTGTELRRRYGVSSTVVQMAVSTLRAEGLITTMTRGGTVVRERPPVRRLAGHRYRQEAAYTPSAPAMTSFTTERDLAWSQYRMDKHYQDVPATARLADLLGCDPGTMLLHRRFVFYARDTPQQVAWTYMPLDLVDGTPITNPDREPWPGGTTAQMAYLGLPLTAVEESVSARMPTPFEADTLDIPPGVPVLAITRRMLHENQPVEVADPIVIPADRTILDYRIDI